MLQVGFMFRYLPRTKVGLISLYFCDVAVVEKGKGLTAVGIMVSKRAPEICVNRRAMTSIPLSS